MRNRIQTKGVRGGFRAKVFTAEGVATVLGIWPTREDAIAAARDMLSLRSEPKLKDIEAARELRKAGAP